MPSVADRHRRLRGEYRQREPPSEPRPRSYPATPARLLKIGRDHLVSGDFFPPFPLFPQLGVARAPPRAMWGIWWMFLAGISKREGLGRGGIVLPRDRHVDSIGVRIVPRRFLKRGDRRTVADPCRPADKTLLEELSDAVRSRPIQLLADQLAQRVGDSLCLCFVSVLQIRRCRPWLHRRRHGLYNIHRREGAIPPNFSHDGQRRRRSFCLLVSDLPGAHQLSAIDRRADQAGRVLHRPADQVPPGLEPRLSILLFGAVEGSSNQKRIERAYDLRSVGLRPG